jgi:hypothetical protein
MRTLDLYFGQIMLLPTNKHLWRRTASASVKLLEMTITDGVLSSGGDRLSREVEPCGLIHLVDPRVRALVDAVNAESIAALRGGKLFLDSVERALVTALVDSRALRRCSGPGASGCLELRVRNRTDS